MRIVAGRHKGRPLQAPEGLDVRPTSDRARQGLFNILEHGGFTEDGTSPLVDAVVLDAFAGTGALGLEALSRGAARLTCMDSEPRAIAVIRANVATLGERARVTLHQADATRPPPGPAEPCSLAFLDPPYRSGLGAPALAALADRGWVADGALCIVEVEAKENFAAPSGFTSFDERRYGKARFVFLRFRT
ncbi:16S rRNA (guanine(966)-N(2))-methyltransferase RsmD [Rhodospirillaceae bacterium SYSU D60014]|uniref:16S rRNA (guanine(966)-N(2))-methyltransferase RsmD n=1 Tax=Virgifigura deserti TaxID=2268457 RepID=UPI000E66F94C